MKRLAQMPRKYHKGEASQRGMTVGWFLLSLISFGVLLQVSSLTGWLGGPGKDNLLFLKGQDF